MFSITEYKYKTFVMILLVCGYARLPRQEMYQERREDCHILVVLAMMTKYNCVESKRYLHLADNLAINSLDKLAKGRPLFNASNDQYILHYQPTQHLNVEDSINMESYFGKHEAKRYIHRKHVKFGFKLWL